MRCEGWQDEDTPLSYQVAVQPSTNGSSAAPLQWLTGKAFSQSLALLLPEGLAQQVWVSVADSRSAADLVSAGQVNVLPFSGLIDNGGGNSTTGPCSHLPNLKLGVLVGS